MTAPIPTASGAIVELDFLHQGYQTQLNSGDRAFGGMAVEQSLSVEWGWAAPAKKNEASIFFPPAKIKGARGHNECRNATRIIMDMDHKPARKSGR